LTITALGDVIRPGTKRGLDFVLLDELRKRTSVNLKDILKFALAEMLCNSLDKDSTEITIDVQNEGSFNHVSIQDDGSKKLSLDEIKLILDFENKASSKRGLLRVSRGYLGNALKCIFGYSYALTESKGLSPPPIIIASGSYEYRICLKPNRIREVIESKIETVERHDDGFTTFTVRFPKQDEDCDPSILEDLIFATSMVNPSRKISYNLFGNEHGTLGSAEGSQDIRQETSVLWYEEKQFLSLFEDFLRVKPETKLKEFIALFRGFTAKNIIWEILQNLNTGNHDCQANRCVQFFPTTFMKDLPASKVTQLFNIMKAKTKPIAKRSIASVLGCVGEKTFEKIRERNGWERLKYVSMAAVKVEPSSFYLQTPSNRVEFPYLIELAVFDRQKDDMEGLKVYQCVNFMASMEDIFSRIYNINYHLGRVGITKEMPVTIVAHLVCPVLKWLNYGKSGLDE